MFAVKRGEAKERLDVTYNDPKFLATIERIAKISIPFGKTIESISGGATPLRANDAQYSDDGIKFLRIQNVTPFGIDLNDVKHIVPEVHNGLLSRSQLATGDLLMTITGRIGTCSVVTEDVLPANINQHIVRIRLKNDLLPEFAAAYLNSDIGQKFSNRGVTGTTRIALDYESIKRIPVPLIDQQEQLRLAEFMNAATQSRSEKLRDASTVVEQAKNAMFTELGIDFPDFRPQTYIYSRLRDIRSSEIFCNQNIGFATELFNALRDSRHYAGNLNEFVDVNPRTGMSALTDDSKVTFIPMPAVGEKNNEVEYSFEKYYAVKSGYTIFQRGDLLWAKITPCMQNGKSCLVEDLPTEIGFGSTEFHVMRKKSDKVYMPFIWALFSNGYILKAAQSMFNGSAGQQRVSDHFLKKFPLILPEIQTQKILADKIFAALDTARVLRAEAETEWATAKAKFERELLGGTGK